MTATGSPESGSSLTRDQSLVEFLRTCPSLTDDPLERVARAESEGFSDEDARAAGAGDLFEMVAAVPPPGLPDEQVVRNPDSMSLLLLRSIGRGIIFIMPVGPISVLWAGSSTPAELIMMWATVVLAWGLGMAFSFWANTLGARPGGREIDFMRHALLLGLVTSSAVLLSLVVLVPELSFQAAMFSGIQFMYVLAANALFVMGRSVLLMLAMLPGTLATIWFWSLPSLGNESSIALLALSTLGWPVVAAFWLLRGRVGRLGGLGAVDRSTAARFALFGFASAIVVLWLPVRVPGSVSIWLGLGLLLCLPIAELAVALGRSQTSRLLRTYPDLSGFQRAAKTAIVLSSLAYGSVLALVLGVDSLILVGNGENPEIVIAVAVGFFLVGITQLLSSFCVTYQELRTASLSLGGAVLVLLGTSWLLRSSVEGQMLGLAVMLAVLIATGLVLSSILLRALRLPVSHL